MGRSGPRACPCLLCCPEPQWPQLASVVAVCRGTDVLISPAVQTLSHSPCLKGQGGLSYLARWGLLQFLGTNKKGLGWGQGRGQGRIGETDRQAGLCLEGRGLGGQ